MDATVAAVVLSSCYTLLCCGDIKHNLTGDTPSATKLALQSLTRKKRRNISFIHTAVLVQSGSVRWNMRECKISPDWSFQLICWHVVRTTCLAPAVIPLTTADRKDGQHFDFRLFKYVRIIKNVFQKAYSGVCLVGNMQQSFREIQQFIFWDGQRARCRPNESDSGFV